VKYELIWHSVNDVHFLVEADTEVRRASPPVAPQLKYGESIGRKNV
jgi:hypothetical protein